MKGIIRIVASLVILMSLLTCLCSCNTNEGSNESTSEVLPTWTAVGDFSIGEYYDISYEGLAFESDEYELGVRDIVFGQGYIAGLTIGYNEEIEQAEQRWINNMGTAFETVLPTGLDREVCVRKKFITLFDYDANIIANIDLDEVQGYSYELPVMKIDCFNNLHVIVCNGDNETDSLTYYDLTFDSEGELLNESVLEFDQYVDIYKICYDENGYLYALVSSKDSAEPRLYKFDNEGLVVSNILIEGYFAQDVISVAGSAYMIGRVYDSETRGYSVYMIPIEDAIAGNVNNGTLLPVEFTEVSEIVTTLDGTGLLFSNNPMIYAYDIETNELIETLNVSSSNSPYYCYYFGVRENGEIVYAGTDSLSTDWYLIEAIPTDVDPYEGREVITLAGVGLEDPIVQNMVWNFNLNNDEYYIEMVDYSNGVEPYSDEWNENYQSYYQAMLEDIRLSNITGDAPDIIVDVEGVFSIEEIATDDFLVDLSGYYDSELRTSLSSWTTPMLDNEVYTAFLSYSVDVMVMDSTMVEVDTLDDIDYETYENLANESGFTGPSAYSLLRDYNSFLREVLSYRMQDFYNIETQEVSFDSPEFVELLEWIRANVISGTEEPYAIGDGAFAELCSYGPYILFNGEGFVAPSNIAIVGVPQANSSIIAAKPGYIFAITNNCSVPDVAWEFISMGYQERYQNPISRITFPIVDEYMSSYYENNANQNDPLYEQNLELHNQIINSVNAIAVNNQEVTTIVLEEANAYFYGDRTALEVAEYIQDRASTVMSERYG